MAAEILSAPNLCELSGVRQAFFSKAWGDINISLLQSADAEALHTVERMASHFKISEKNLAFCRQIHSSRVITIDHLWPLLEAPEADAMVTNRDGIALGLFTADCVPVLFADAEAKVIGAAHAGWRGAIGGVLENTVAAMEKLGAEKKAIRAALGPCIAQQSYEVGPDFPAPFLSEHTENKRFFVPSTRANHFQFDLPGYVMAKLHAISILNVAPSPADTYAEPDRFFSYRYASQRGQKADIRLVSAIMMSESK